MKSTLNCAFLHLAIKHADPDSNRKLILDNFTEAALSGADLIIAPEMATSGYAFDSPTHAAQYAEDIDGPFIKELRGCCRETG